MLNFGRIICCALMVAMLVGCKSDEYQKLEQELLKQRIEEQNR